MFDFIKIYGINIFLIIILFFCGKFILKQIVKKIKLHKINLGVIKLWLQSKKIFLGTC